MLGPKCGDGRIARQAGGLGFGNPLVHFLRPDIYRR